MRLNFLIIFFIFFFKTNIFANENISFVDIDYLFENSNLGKEIALNIKRIHDQNLNNLNTKEKELINEENEIKKTKNIVSDEEFNKRVSQLREKVNIFNKEKEIIIKNFSKEKNKELKIFFDKINPILQNYMETNSISVLLEKKNIFLGKSSHDITLKILNIIDKELQPNG